LQALAAANTPSSARKTLRLLRTAGISRAALPFHAQNRRLALAMLVTRLLALPLGDDALQTYGLGQPLSAFVAGETVSDHQASLWTIELCQAIGTASEIQATASESTFLPQLFSNPQIRSFLLVHDDNATTWFNKERLEEVLKWLTLLSVFEKVRGTGSKPVPVKEVLNLAGAAGYRLPLLLQMAEESWEKQA
jgi:hypothetical protein